MRVNCSKIKQIVEVNALFASTFTDNSTCKKSPFIKCYIYTITTKTTYTMHCSAHTCLLLSLRAVLDIRYYPALNLWAQISPRTLRNVAILICTHLKISWIYNIFNGLALNSSIERDMYVQVYVHFHEIKYFVKAANLKFPFYSSKIHGFYEIKDFVYYVKKQ